MLDADKAITKRDQDRLNRTLFGKYLARSMLDHVQPESLVVGLYGGWGVGKTSVINLTLEELRLASSAMLETEMPIILNFNPWTYSGQKQLTTDFFRELITSIRLTPELQNSRRIADLLEQYLTFFIPHMVTKHSWLENIVGNNNEDMHSVKVELNELLALQKQKIIIIIDNISQLLNDEIKEIFQLVKTIADFSQTIYLLSYDKDQVIHAINNLDAHGGEEFIEKVVQLPFAIPPIAQQDLENILFSRLEQTLSEVPEDSWNQEYWAEIYYSSIKFFFDHCRDITRYVNTLNFGYVRVKELVNPVDYFALTAIEVFLPEVYIGIRDNKDLFTDLIEHVYQWDEKKLQQEKKRCDEILARNSKVSHAILLDLVLKLFPRLRHIYQPNMAFYHSEAIAQKTKRICDPDFFDVYFRLSMPTGNIPDSEFKTLLESSVAQDIFSENLLRLNQDGRILKFLNQLDSIAINTVPLENISNIVSALINDGDFFPEEQMMRLNLSTPMRIHRIIHRLLRRFDATEERFAILQQAIAIDTNSLYIMVYELTEQESEHLEESDTFLPMEFRDLTPKQLDNLQHLAATRIQSWAHLDRLVEHPKLLVLLLAWKKWGNEKECQEYVKKMIGSDRGLIAFLMAVFAEPIEEAVLYNEMHKDWDQYLTRIDEFLPKESLVAHARTLFEDLYFEKLREREQLALLIFLYVMNVDTKKIIPKTTV